MSIALIVLVFASFINITLGVVVLLRNPRSGLGRSFAAISVALTAWALANFFTEQATVLSQNIFFNRLAFVFAFLSVLTMLVFSYVLRRKQPIRSGELPIIILTIVLLSAFSATDSAAGSVTKESGELVFWVGDLAVVWAVLLLAVLVMTIRNLVIIARTGTAREKNQARAISIGMSMTVILALTTNIILPAISAENGISSFDYAKFGPSTTVFTVFTTAFAIIKHGLFDINRLIARSVAYTLTVLALISLYSFLLRVVVAPIVGHDLIAQNQTVYISLFSAFAGLTFQPLKSFFARVSGGLFYRDDYDLRAALEAMSNALVANAQLEHVMKSSTDMIYDTLKPTNLKFILLKDNKVYKQVSVGDPAKHLKTSDIQFLLKIKSELTLSDWEIDTENYSQLSSLQLGVVQRFKIQGGYTVLLLAGAKKNGSIYSSKDKSFLRISAKNLEVAVEDALKYREIQEFNITLKQKIEEATKKLKLANKNLKELSQTKADFVSMASHQLRPQLAAAEGFLDLLKLSAEDRLIKDEQENLMYAQRSLQRMMHIVFGILETAAQESPVISLSLRPYDIATLVRDETIQIKRQNKDRSFQIEAKSGRNTASVNIDPEKIKEVMYNLLQNAVDHTKSGDTVRVSISQKNGFVTVSVQDSGKGMPESVVAKVFDRFYRAESSIINRPSGTGVGLYVVKLFVEAHGGSVLVSSKLDRGSTFSFMLPVNGAKLSEK